MREPQPKGIVRIRSNVCNGPFAWHLVPGDILRKYSLPVNPDSLTDKQKEELLYYAPCSICNRVIIDINKEGCGNPDCRMKRPR
jgi:hypothetical protein